MEPLKRKAMSGRLVDELTVDRVCDGELQSSDIRIHPDTLLLQAGSAEQFGNPQLAESLRRGAEMTQLDDAELMRLYDALRPGRSTGEELRAIAADLEARGLSQCAQLVEEAAGVYTRRRLTT